jgi:uncharacterized protein YwgA
MDYKKASLVLAVIRSLKQHGSWTGKTHVQKSLFLIKAATQIDVPFTFVLFKHGPYSFGCNYWVDLTQPPVFCRKAVHSPA